MVWRKYYILSSLLILVLLLTGCLATSTIDISKNEVVPEKESVVFGRVNLILGGEPVIWRKLSIPMHSGQIFVLTIATSKAVIYNLTGDGSFYWHLPPGDYSIAAIEFAAGGGNINARIFADFQVPEEKSVIYIGKLTLVFSKLRYYMNVEDDYEQEIEKFKNKFPEIKGEIVKNLMKLEKKR